MSAKKEDPKKGKDWIPDEWTFASEGVADNFDSHVREQLPWYELVTSAIVHMGRHYIPEDGLVYDVGASTGNIATALGGILESRNARMIGVEKEAEMAAKYSGPGEVVVADAITYGFEPFDFAVRNLTLMFMPVATRIEWLAGLIKKTRKGGAIVVVDKIDTPPGYIGTALRRLTMDWKRKNGASAEDILKKELSLAGIQRPVSPDVLRVVAPGITKFFQLGEFCGWVIEARP